MIAGLLHAMYTAHPLTLLAIGSFLGTCAGFLLGVWHEQRWWRLRVRCGALA